VALSGGDARRSLTYLEAAAEAVPDGGALDVPGAGEARGR